MKNKKAKLTTTAEALLIFFITFVFCYFNVFAYFDTILTDRLYQKPRALNNKIKIIGIDDDTLRELGPMGTWSRQIYADIINILGDHPAEIVFDLMITGNMDEAGDEAFREACRTASVPVIAGSQIDFRTNFQYSENGIVYIDNYSAVAVDMPIAECETGFVNTFPDDDGLIRSAALVYNYNDEQLESLAYKTYRLYCQKYNIPDNYPRLDNGKMNIFFAGKPRDYEEVSLARVINGDVAPEIFTDCVVFVGAYASGLYDQYAVPNSSDIMFGTEIHANIFQALYDGVFPVSANRMIVSLLCSVTVCLLFILFRYTELKISLPLAVVFGAGYLILAVSLADKGTLIPVLYFPLFDIAVVILTVIHHYVNEYQDKKQISEAFRKYVAPQVVDEITQKGGFTLKLGGESREVAVLFVDIRGFTPMSESLEPEQVVDILNSYLELTTNSIFNNGGTLDKFIGDATMAVFNAPFDLDDHIFKACKTALDIVAGGDAIESRFLEKYGKSVGFGVGVNCGRAVVGNIGCSFRMDYTAIGDTVNTAARLEANAKRGQVLISEYVYEQVKDRIIAEPVGAIPLKGKSKSVFVYSLTGLVDDKEKTTEEE